MNTVDLSKLELVEGRFANDESVHFRANFALFGGNGAEDSSAVYIELQPGEALGEHMDSPEEILLVLEGDVEMRVGLNRVRASQGTLGVVPPMVPHSIHNIGSRTARVVGFFPSPGVVATFIEPVQPLGERVLTFGEVAPRAAVS